MKSIQKRAVSFITAMLLMFGFALWLPEDATVKTYAIGDLAAIAEAEIGNNYYKYTSWYGSIDGTYAYAWCATFVSYCVAQAGIDNVAINAGCISQYNSSTCEKHYVQYGQESFTPCRGDIIYFDWFTDNRGFDHVGIVCDYDPYSGTIYYVDGNGGSGTTTTRKVRKTSINISSDNVQAFMRPIPDPILPTPADIVTPNISFDKSSYTVGDIVEVTWALSPPNSNLENYWITINGPYGEIANQEPSGTSFSFTANTEGTYTITTFAAPLYSEHGEGSLSDTKTIYVNPQAGLITPTISLDKSSYIVGDTVTVSWALSPPNSNLENYWITIYGPSGEIANQEPSGTSFSFTANTEGTYTITTFAAPLYSEHGEDSLWDSKTITIYNAVNLGDNFYALIINADSNSKPWKPIVQDDNNNVVLGTESKFNYDSSLWHFIRNASDGTYTIVSLKNGKVLDLNNFLDEDGNNVSCVNSNSSTAQQWYILKHSERTFKLKAKCASRVLDIKNASIEDGANVQIYSSNNSTAQSFAIYQLDANRDMLNYSITADKSTVTEGANVKVNVGGTIPYVYNYKFYITDPKGKETVIDNGCNSVLEFTTAETGEYSIYAVVKNPLYESLLSEAKNKAVKITVTSAHIHKYSSETTTKATCTKEGIMTYTCSCGDTYTESIPATGHTAKKYSAKAATCTSEGRTAFYYCRQCNKYFSDSACTKQITKASTVVKATGHSYTAIVTAPTCTKGGYTTHTCSACGDSYKDTETPAAEHKFGAWTTKIQPTATSEGKSERECRECHIKETKLIGKLPDENTAQIVVDSVTASAGNTVKIKVSLKNNPGISGLQMKMRYDSSVLTLQNATAKNLAVTFSEKLTANPYSILWYDGLKNVTTNGAIAEFTFKVSDKAAEGSYPITIEFSDDEISDVYDKNVHFEKVNGAVNVLSHIPGDVNGDGKANVKDLIRLQQHLNGWDVTVVAGSTDINGDGKVNVKDLIRLQQYLNGWNVVVN